MFDRLRLLTSYDDDVWDCTGGLSCQGAVASVHGGNYTCYIFHSKSMPATPTITPTRVFVLKGSAAAKSVCGGRFYSTRRRRYLLSDLPKKILKLLKLEQTHTILTRSFTCRMRWVHLQGSYLSPPHQCLFLIDLLLSLLIKFPNYVSLFLLNPPMSPWYWYSRV